METLDLTARYLQEAPLSLLIRLGSSSPSVHGGGGGLLILEVHWVVVGECLLFLTGQG